MIRGLTLPQIIQLIVIILISLTVHEFAHSLVAIALGDETPRKQGRLTLNPFAHIDLVGFLMLILVGFGWAKPVIFNPASLKKPRRDEILIALAGPVSNMILAMVGVVIVWAVLTTNALVSRGSITAFFGFMWLFVSINIGLAVFNMIPIPPLDGSHLVTVFLQKVNATLAATYFRYGSYALLALVVFQLITKIEVLPISRLVDAVARWMFGLLGIQ